MTYLRDGLTLTLGQIIEKGNIEQQRIDQMAGSEVLMDCRERAIERRNTYRECAELITLCMKQEPTKVK